MKPHVVFGPDRQKAEIVVEQRRDLAGWMVSLSRNGSLIRQELCGTEVTTLHVVVAFRSMVMDGEV